LFASIKSEDNKAQEQCALAETNDVAVSSKMGLLSGGGFAEVTQKGKKLKISSETTFSDICNPQRPYD
jgi:hypothetical protein